MYVCSQYSTTHVLLIETCAKGIDVNGKETHFLSVSNQVLRRLSHQVPLLAYVQDTFTTKPVPQYSTHSFTTACAVLQNWLGSEKPRT